MSDRQDFRIWLEGLRLAMNQWQKTQRDEKTLLQGTALHEAKEQLQQHRDQLSPMEQEFIQASLAQHLQNKNRINYWWSVPPALIIGIVLGICGWLEYTTPGQITQMRWKLTNRLTRVPQTLTDNPSNPNNRSTPIFDQVSNRLGWRRTPHLTGER
ncbi:MAG: hypothetical protein AAFO04_19725, partial [Cyanobacteria bacterium J06592_8]